MSLERPDCYVVVSNLQSGGNIGRIVRSASIFGATAVLVVGQRKWRLSGDHGSRFDIQQRHFYSHEEVRGYLKSAAGGVKIWGVEIAEDAAPLMRFDRSTGTASLPFNGPAAFVLGNEGAGLSERQRAIVDECLYIPQSRGGGGSASLNVACAAAIVLHAYATWAGYGEAARDGEKFSLNGAPPAPNTGAPFQTPAGAAPDCAA
jgi:tRNA G18 (ribose-2'-O)-methylase SpoU